MEENNARQVCKEAFKLFRNGQKISAIEHLRKTPQFDKNYLLLYGYATITFLSESEKKHPDQRAIDEAINYYERAIRLNPTDVLSYFGAGAAYRRKAMILAPASALSKTSMMTELSAQGLLLKSIEKFKEAEKVDDRFYDEAEEEIAQTRSIKKTLTSMIGRKFLKRFSSS